MSIIKRLAFDIFIKTAFKIYKGDSKACLTMIQMVIKLVDAAVKCLTTKHMSKCPL